ncbi:hypothetical protein EHS25_008622 [Saitozyma podzolica]|uniref:Senescence domain-containing protein n=1 Tax=Saitozyma podzolica TaxID=1890683 RepID=A0A427YMC2_9TREE|nr:hypothetical protein EHS25_008622 [Saitozyma podzolica]
MSVPVAMCLGADQGDEREERADWRIRELDEDDEEYWEVEDDEQQDKLARRKDVYEEEEEEDDDEEEEDDDDEEEGDTYEEFSRNGWEAVHEQPWAQPSPRNDRVHPSANITHPNQIPAAPAPTAISSYSASSPPTSPSPSPGSHTALEVYQPTVETATASAGWLQTDHSDTAPQTPDSTDSPSLIGATSKLASSCIRSGARLTSSLLESTAEGIASAANYAEEHGTQIAENLALGIRDVVSATAGAVGELAGPAVAVTRSAVVLGAEMTAWTAKAMGEHGPDALRSVCRTLSGISSSFVENSAPPKPKSRLKQGTPRLGFEVKKCSRIQREPEKRQYNEKTIAIEEQG